MNTLFVLLALLGPLPRAGGTLPQIDAGDVDLDGGKLYGDKLADPNTYCWRSAADTWVCVCGGVDALTLNGTTATFDVALVHSYGTVADGDATPSVSGADVWTTQANTGATVITDLDSPTAGSTVFLIGGSNANSSTIVDSGNFNLDQKWGGMTLTTDAWIALYVQADNDYIETGRGDNTNLDALTLPASNGLTIGTSVPFSDSSGTLSLTNIDLLDSTTETTIEAAIDTCANLTSIQSQTVTLAGTLDVEVGGCVCNQDLTTDANVGFTQVTVGNTGLVVGTSTPFSDSSGTLTCQNIDAIDSTTETTIESAIDELGTVAITEVRIGTTPHASVSVNGTVKTFDLSSHGADVANRYVAYLDRASDTHSTTMILLRARGEHDAPTAVANNDIIGQLDFAGWDGTDGALGAQIRAIVDGTPGADDMPTELVFLTSPDNAQTPVARLTIAPAGGITAHSEVIFGSQTSYTVPATNTVTTNAATVDWSTGDSQVVDLEGASGTVTVTMSNPLTTGMFLRVIQGTQLGTIVFAPVIHTAGGVALTAITGTDDAVDDITFWYDGAAYAKIGHVQDLKAIP